MEDMEGLMRVFIAQMESSMKISKIVSNHFQEDKLSPDSVVIGLVYRLLYPMTDEEMKTSIERAEEIMNSETSDSEEEEFEESEGQEREIRKVKHPVCNCDICMKARMCLLNYESYENYEPLTIMFKNAIDKACEVNKLTI
tara:strand:+ start:602 stop:1024 length:423 start_codon:yes stop_codon:yes gene_type:complete